MQDHHEKQAVAGNPIAAAYVPGQSPTAAQTLLDGLWRSPDRIHQIVVKDGRTKKFKHFPIKSVAAAVRLAVTHSGAGSDVYFACAEYRTPDSRTVGNVSGAFGFWMDFDCGEKQDIAGKGYLTVEEAEEAIRDFCRVTGLPEPTHIVYTGGGLHAYWVLGKLIEREKWQAYAAMLKDLAKVRGLLADPSRTADISSVLRVPGTLNFKYGPPRPVTLQQASEEFIEFAAMLGAIDQAHSKFCTATAPSTPTHHGRATRGARVGSAGGSPPCAVDLARLASALTVLDPDCEDEIWKLRRLAPLAEAAGAHPELSEALYKLAMSWSSGALRGLPSQKWRHAVGNGLAGEQVFASVWERFLRSDYPGIPTTLGTVFFDAADAGWTWVDPEDRFETVEDEVEGGE